MGSPYFVHAQVNRIHVVKSLKGLGRVLATIRGTMEKVSLEYSPEWAVLRDIYASYQKAWLHNQRSMVFLEARYEWTGWEKFQRVVIFDFSGSPAFDNQSLPDNIVSEYELNNDCDS